MLLRLCLQKKYVIVAIHHAKHLIALSDSAASAIRASAGNICSAIITKSLVKGTPHSGVSGVSSLSRLLALGLLM